MLSGAWGDRSAWHRRWADQLGFTGLAPDSVVSSRTISAASDSAVASAILSSLSASTSVARTLSRTVPVGFRAETCGDSSAGVSSSSSSSITGSRTPGVSTKRHVRRDPLLDVEAPRVGAGYLLGCLDRDEQLRLGLVDGGGEHAQAESGQQCRRASSWRPATTIGAGSPSTPAASLCPLVACSWRDPAAVLAAFRLVGPDEAQPTCPEQPPRIGASVLCGFRSGHSFA